MNILFLVVVAILYAVSGLVKKARDRNIKLEDQPRPGAPPPSKRQPQRAPVRPAPSKPVSAARRAQLPPQSWPSPRPALQHPRAPKPAAVRAQAQPLTEAEELTILPAEPTAAEIFAAETATEELVVRPEAEGPEALAPGLVLFGEPVDLRTAIVHYEIFGKPLALRQSGGAAWLNP